MNCAVLTIIFPFLNVFAYDFRVKFYFLEPSCQSYHGISLSLRSKISENLITNTKYQNYLFISSKFRVKFLLDPETHSNVATSRNSQVFHLFTECSRTELHYLNSVSPETETISLDNETKRSYPLIIDGQQIDIAIQLKGKRIQKRSPPAAIKGDLRAINLLNRINVYPLHRVILNSSTLDKRFLEILEGQVTLLNRKIAVSTSRLGTIQLYDQHSSVWRDTGHFTISQLLSNLISFFAYILQPDQESELHSDIITFTIDTDKQTQMKLQVNLLRIHAKIITKTIFMYEFPESFGQRFSDRILITEQNLYTISNIKFEPGDIYYQVVSTPKYGHFYLDKMSKQYLGVGSIFTHKHVLSNLVYYQLRYAVEGRNVLLNEDGLRLNLSVPGAKFPSNVNLKLVYYKLNASSDLIKAFTFKRNFFSKRVQLREGGRMRLDSTYFYHATYESIYCENSKISGNFTTLITLTQLPKSGKIILGGKTSQDLSLNRWFTRETVEEDSLIYVHDGSEVFQDGISFTIDCVNRLVLNKPPSSSWINENSLVERLGIAQNFSIEFLIEPVNDHALSVKALRDFIPIDEDRVKIIYPSEFISVKDEDVSREESLYNYSIVVLKREYDHLMAKSIGSFVNMNDPDQRPVYSFRMHQVFNHQIGFLPGKKPIEGKDIIVSDGRFTATTRILFNMTKPRSLLVLNGDDQNFISICNNQSIYLRLISNVPQNNDMIIRLTRPLSNANLYILRGEHPAKLSLLDNFMYRDLIEHRIFMDFVDSNAPSVAILSLEFISETIRLLEQVPVQLSHVKCARILRRDKSPIHQKVDINFNWNEPKMIQFTSQEIQSLGLDDRDIIFQISKLPTQGLIYYKDETFFFENPNRVSYADIKTGNIFYRSKHSENVESMELVLCTIQNGSDYTPRKGQPPNKTLVTDSITLEDHPSITSCQASSNEGMLFSLIVSIRFLPSSKSIVFKKNGVNVGYHNETKLSLENLNIQHLSNDSPFVNYPQSQQAERKKHLPVSPKGMEYLKNFDLRTMEPGRGPPNTIYEITKSPENGKIISLISKKTVRLFSSSDLKRQDIAYRHLGDYSSFFDKFTVSAHDVETGQSVLDETIYILISPSDSYHPMSPYDQGKFIGQGTISNIPTEFAPLSSKMGNSLKQEIVPNSFMQLTLSKFPWKYFTRQYSPAQDVNFQVSPEKNVIFYMMKENSLVPTTKFHYSDLIKGSILLKHHDYPNSKSNSQDSQSLARFSLTSEIDEMKVTFIIELVSIPGLNPVKDSLPDSISLEVNAFDKYSMPLCEIFQEFILHQQVLDLTFLLVFESQTKRGLFQIHPDNLLTSEKIILNPKDLVNQCYKIFIAPTVLTREKDSLDLFIYAMPSITIAREGLNLHQLYEHLVVDEEPFKVVRVTVSSHNESLFLQDDFLFPLIIEDETNFKVDSRQFIQTIQKLPLPSGLHLKDLLVFMKESPVYGNIPALSSPISFSEFSQHLMYIPDKEEYQNEPFDQFCIYIKWIRVAESFNDQQKCTKIYLMSHPQWGKLNSTYVPLVMPNRFQVFDIFQQLNFVRKVKRHSTRNLRFLSKDEKIIKEPYFIDNQRKITIIQLIDDDKPNAHYEIITRASTVESPRAIFHVTSYAESIPLRCFISAQRLPLNYLVGDDFLFYFELKTLPKYGQLFLDSVPIRKFSLIDLIENRVIYSPLRQAEQFPKEILPFSLVSGNHLEFFSGQLEIIDQRKLPSSMGQDDGFEMLIHLEENETSISKALANTFGMHSLDCFVLGPIPEKLTGQFSLNHELIYGRNIVFNQNDLLTFKGPISARQMAIPFTVDFKEKSAKGIRGNLVLLMPAIEDTKPVLKGNNFQRDHDKSTLMVMMGNTTLKGSDRTFDLSLNSFLNEIFLVGIFPAAISLILIFTFLAIYCFIFANNRKRNRCQVKNNLEGNEDSFRQLESEQCQKLLPVHDTHVQHQLQPQTSLWTSRISSSPSIISHNQTPFIGHEQTLFIHHPLTSNAGLTASPQRKGDLNSQMLLIPTHYMTLSAIDEPNI